MSSDSSVEEYDMQYNESDSEDVDSIASKDLQQYEEIHSNLKRQMMPDSGMF